jgi:hypothetical protein
MLDQLLAGGVAALVDQGLVALDVLAQDGLKVRAAAGTGSFRRRERLGKLAAAATARVVRLRAELEADPAAGDRRHRAAQQRAAREREERVKAALDRLSELEIERARREKTNKAEVRRQKEPHASTTDAEARAMRLADGGFRPGLQHADRVGAKGSDHRRGRHRHHGLRSRLGAPGAGRHARCRHPRPSPATTAPSSARAPAAPAPAPPRAPSPYRAAPADPAPGQTPTPPAPDDRAPRSSIVATCQPS